MSLISVEAARAAILRNVAPVGVETVSIAEADGRRLAEPLCAGHDQPPFNSTSMDGYAVRGDDVTDVPSRLTVIGEAAAGHVFNGKVGPGEAVRIFTGAPLPAGADAIVIQENTQRDGATVIVRDGTPDPSHIRRRGFDFRAGAELIGAGVTLSPRTLTLAAAMGHGSVSVRRKPRVALIATGDELVKPGTPPGPGQIVCSNPFGIAAIARRAGADVRNLGIARDTVEDLDAKLTRAGDADVIVTIGGASVGDHDLVRPAWEARGLTLDFWKVAMRPGKPLMYGRSGDQHVLGLPGNPVSSLVCARVFLVPLIAQLLDTDDTAAAEAAPLLAKLTVPIEANGPRRHYMRARSFLTAEGQRLVTPVESQDSSLLTRLADADVFIVRPPGASALAADADVEILAIDF